MSDDAARIEALEVKVAHFEHAHAQMSDELALQQRELELLREGLRVLARRMASAEEPSGASATAHEPPPHY